MRDGISAKENPPTVEELLNLAVVIANSNSQALHKRWITAQYSLPEMPSSMLTAFSQIISLDLLLRQLENERQPTVSARSVELIYVDQIFMTLSETWMSQVYEILRVISSRAKARGGELTDALEAVKHAATLVRMGVDKGEVADMHTKRKQSTIQIQLQNSDGEIVPDYVNDGSWIVPRGVRLDSGSCMWWCIDVSTGSPRTVEVCRREVSDQLLEALIDARETRPV